MRAGFTSPPTTAAAAGAAGCFELSPKSVLSEFCAESVSLFNSSVGSTSPFGCALAECLTFGLASRTAPREGFLISGSTDSTDVPAALVTSLFAFGFGMRSVIAAVCILP